MQRVYLLGIPAVDRPPVKSTLIIIVMFPGIWDPFAMPQAARLSRRRQETNTPRTNQMPSSRILGYYPTSAH